MALVLEPKINDEKSSDNGKNKHKLVHSDRVASAIVGYNMATTNGVGKCVENGVEKSVQQQPYNQKEKTMLKQQSQNDTKTPTKQDSKSKYRDNDGELSSAHCAMLEISKNFTRSLAFQERSYWV